MRRITLPSKVIETSTGKAHDVFHTLLDGSVFVGDEMEHKHLTCAEFETIEMNVSIE